jgi:hypothetical protein
MDRAPGFDSFRQEGYQAAGRSIRKNLHADAPDACPVFLCRDGNQGLTFGLPASDAFLQAPQIGFVYLHRSCQPVTARPHHRSPELVQPGPGRLVAAQAQHSLQTQCTGAVLLARQPVHRPQPVHQGFARVLKDGARGHQRLMPTGLALHEHRPNRPEGRAPTARAAEPAGPAQAEQVSRQACSVSNWATNSARERGNSSMACHTTGWGYLSQVNTPLN